MMVIVSYDVHTEFSAGRRRLRRISKACLNYGQRVQNSVFECEIDPAQWATFKGKLMEIYQEKEDSLRFYFLGRNWQNRVEHHGIKPSVNLNEPIIL